MITSESFRSQYNGNGVATSFAYGFPVSNKAYVLAVKTNSGGTDSALVVDVDYTVNGVGSANSSDWTITYPISGSPLATGEKLTLTPNFPLLQQTNFNNQGSYYQRAVEAAFDFLTVIAQGIKEGLNRCMKFPTSDTSPTTTLPNATNRANKMLGFDGSGNPTLVANADSSAISAAASAANALISETNAANSAASLDLRNISTQAGAYTVISGNKNGLINYTGSGHTLTLTAAATLGAKFELHIMNAGTGVLTIDPNASETIDGSATLALLPGEFACIVCDGTNWLLQFLTNTKGPTVNAQTGTSYTILYGDRGKLITFSNAAAVAVTLPQATGLFGSRFWMFVQNKGAGAVTITPTTSTIDGAATLALTQNQGCLIVSDGTNYSTMRGIGGGSGGATGTRKSFNLEAGTSLTTILSAPPSGKVWLIESLIVKNNDTTDRTFDLEYNDGTDTILLEDDYTLNKKCAVKYKNIVIPASGYIKVLGSAATTIYVQCTYTEYANTDYGGDGISLGTSATDIIAAVGASKVRKVVGLYIHNTTTSDKTFTLTHKDATSGTEINLENAYTLNKKCSKYFENIHCAAGGYLKGLTSGSAGDCKAVLAYREESV